jgi:hypothetical protein
MINREVYEKDPSQNRLLNQGVAKVTSGQTDPELQTLRFEITSFVCDGQYAQGMERILRNYLTNLDKTEQPGVWVSGFYGSGKSHLVKMLQYLWTDYEFPDGVRARGLAKLPQNIKELLVELSTQARRKGGLHAAAGTLGAGAGDSVRLELLSLIFRSRGLPSQYSRASFLLWLREEGLEEAVRGHVAAAGGDFDKELTNLYVSDAIARAILAGRPGFAGKPAEVKLLLQKQFPKVNDISIDDLIEKIRLTLGLGGKKGKGPCLLIVLDEVQQYIGDSLDRSKAVQDLQEQCCARLGAHVLLVATGQNALSATPLLIRLQGRFPVTIELQDTDVEQVTREVVLKKKPSAEPALKALLETHSGEIERHLAGTKIAFTARDRSILVHDYPLLPVRRRFWERVLRAVDKAGTGAQLRTQLWIVYDAVEKTADLPLGNVVDAAFLYDHIKSRVLQSGVLLQEIAETIAKQVHEEDGLLRFRICALIFLIGQLPHDSPNDAGVRATPETIADLLVTDLNQSSAELRKEVGTLLEKLAAEGAVMRVENEYRMQTREGSEWNQAYQAALTKLVNDDGKLASERSQLLKTACNEAFEKRKLVHGESKEPRKFDLHFGAEAPETSGANVPVWIRDGWEVEEKSVLGEVRAAGDSAAVVYGYIPRKGAEELKRVIAGYSAALTTIHAKGHPGTPEGIEAKRAMETRLEQARKSRDDLIEDLLNATQVYVAGDADPVGGMLLETKVHEAARSCLDRLYPRFHESDHPDWHRVIDRSRKGDGDALEAVGHKGDPDKHPVCSAVLGYVGSGKKGTDVRKRFANPPYGWPQDAIDSALVVLHGAGMIQARLSGELVTKGKLDQKNLTTTEFRVEHVMVTKVELIGLRALFGKAGLTVHAGQEPQAAADFLGRVRALGESAGGDPPLPKRPDLSHVQDLAQRAGNDQLKAISEARDRLAAEMSDWRARADKVAQRQPRWDDLLALLEHAEGLPIAAGFRSEVEAIEWNRSLLAGPDPVPGMVEAVTQALRDALNDARARCELARQEGRESLVASQAWERLKPEDRASLTAQYWLDSLPAVRVGSTEEVLDSLRAMKLPEWGTLCDALPTRFSQALAAAVKLLEPKAQHVKLSGGTIKDEHDLSAWLKGAEDQIRAKLQDGPVIL